MIGTIRQAFSGRKGWKEGREPRGLKGSLAGQSVKEGRQNLGSGPERKKRRGFHKTMGWRKGGMGISGEKQQGQGTSPIVMRMFLRNALACMPGVFIEPLVD